MRPSLFVVFVALIVFAVTRSLQAEDAVPKLINYQGKLTDAGGGALGDGEYSVRFELFDDPVAAETLVWGEVRTVMVVGGIFNVALGGAGSVPVPGSAVNDISFAFGNADRYLQTTIVSGPGVAVEQVLLPRQQMMSVPFAMTALHGVPPGTLVPFAGQVIPDGWVACDGSMLDGSDPRYEALFGSIQTIYGAGLESEFRLPDMRGRVPVGLDTETEGQFANRIRSIGDGSSGLETTSIGDSGGEDAHVLSMPEMPRHNHDYNDPGHSHRQTVSPYLSGNFLIATTGGRFETHITGQSPRTERVGTGITMNYNGNGKAHNNVQPSLILNYIIKL